jgi:hypothetical protein
VVNVDRARSTGALTSPKPEDAAWRFAVAWLGTRIEAGKDAGRP